MEPKKFLEHLSGHLKNVIARAIAVANSLGMPDVEPGHLLLAMSEEEGSLGYEILKKTGLDSTIVYDTVSDHTPLAEELLTKGKKESVLPALNADAKRALEKAMLVAYEKSHTYVGTEHLLYGLLGIQNHVVSESLRQARVTKKSIREQLELTFQGTSRFPDIDEVSDMMDQMNSDDADQGQMKGIPLPGFMNTAPAQKPLEQFATTLTDKAYQKNCDPVIGRDKEIDRLIHILSRRTKNNPLLLGEPGVGKTAIVEGLAKRITEGTVPDILKRKKIVAIDLPLLISGTMYRGEFEGRLKQLIDEIGSSDDTIMFIDEIHNIVGAGSNQGTMDAANMLKPALARGHLRCIGATTNDEYTKYIQNDPALDRRFQPIFVQEPSKADAIAILQGVKKYYDEFHHTNITDDAVRAAVELSSKYIHDNHLPDKALDLLDEAAASVRAMQKTNPKDAAYYDCVDAIAELEEQKQEAVQAEKFEAAMALKKEIAVLKKQKQALGKARKAAAARTQKKRVTGAHIAQTLARRLDIDAKQLDADEWQLIKQLPKTIKQHIVGQDAAVDQVADRLFQSHIGLRDTKKPLASFLFAGPSGVGKTELARVLAQSLYQDTKALIKIDMSEFSEAHSVAKLLGSPAGYVGHDNRNRFVEEVRRRPHSVVLFDEFDKAHPDVQRLLLQILDEGEIKESRGKIVPFSHTIIILTTNVGAELYKSSGIGFGASEKEQNTSRNTSVDARLKQEFGSALMSRINTTCLFSPLTQDHLVKIAENHIVRISADLKTNKDISITADKKALGKIAARAHHPDLGARHLENHLHDILHQSLRRVLEKSQKQKTYLLTTSTANDFELKS